MKNKIIKKLIILGVIIFSLAMANSVKAATPDCIISNFKANGKTSITVLSGNQVALSWNTINCSSVSILGHNINTNVTQNGTIIINPTVSSDFKITALNGYFPFQSQTVEVTVIPAQAQAPVSTNLVLPTQYNYYPTQSAVVGNASTTSSASTNMSGTNNNLKTSDSNNSITALSLRGSGSFMPSSIWQWIFVVILILAIIIISRMLIRRPTVIQESHTSSAH